MWRQGRSEQGGKARLLGPCRAAQRRHPHGPGRAAELCQVLGMRMPSTLTAAGEWAHHSLLPQVASLPQISQESAEKPGFKGRFARFPRGMLPSRQKLWLAQARARWAWPGHARGATILTAPRSGGGQDEEGTPEHSPQSVFWVSLRKGPYP